MSENRKDEFWRSLFNEDFPNTGAEPPEQSPEQTAAEPIAAQTPESSSQEPLSAYELKLKRASERYDRREQKRLERERQRLIKKGIDPDADKEPPAPVESFDAASDEQFSSVYSQLSAENAAEPPPEPEPEPVEPEPWYREIPARFIETVTGMRERREKRRDKRELKTVVKEQELSKERSQEIDRYRESPIRQYRSRKTGCVGAVLYFVFVVCVSVVLAALAWMTISDVLSFGFEDAVVEITVPENFEMDEVIAELKDKGVIKYEKVFGLYARVTNAEEKIDPGTYTLNKRYDYIAIVSYMQNYDIYVPLETVSLRVSEGSTIWQVIDVLVENEVCEREALVEAAANYDFDYDFLDDSTLGQANRLEGYLFPDTYEFYKNGSAEETFAKLLDNFESKLTQTMLTDIEASGRSLYEIITIASLIEKETDGTDRDKIASVIYNRLNNPGYETVGLLQIDAALYYGLDKSMDEKLTNEDLEVDTPYNTYLHQGLTPTPIASPSLASIEAAIYPAETDYYYYALGDDGLHHYSRTLAEQNAFLASLG